MMVDEYQDTNVAQYLWLRLLAQASQEFLRRRRRRSIDLWLARRRGRQHPALRARLSRREGGAAGAQLPLHRPHPRRCLASDRAQSRAAGQDAVHRRRTRQSREGARRVGWRSRSAAGGDDIEAWVTQQAFLPLAHRAHRLRLGARGRRWRVRAGSAALQSASRSPLPLSASGGGEKRVLCRLRRAGARGLADAGVRRTLPDAAHSVQGHRRAALFRARRSARRACLSAPDPLRG